MNDLPAVNIERKLDKIRVKVGDEIREQNLENS